MKHSLANLEFKRNAERQLSKARDSAKGTSLLVNSM